MARKRRHPEPSKHSRAYARYGPHTYYYDVYRALDGRAYYIIFEGRFAPYAIARTEDEIAAVAQDVLTSFVDRRVSELAVRAAYAFGITQGES